MPKRKPTKKATEMTTEELTKRIFPSKVIRQIQAEAEKLGDGPVNRSSKKG